MRGHHGKPHHLGHQKPVRFQFVGGAEPGIEAIRRDSRDGSSSSSLQRRLNLSPSGLHFYRLSSQRTGQNVNQRHTNSKRSMPNRQSTHEREAVSDRPAPVNGPGKGFR